MLHKDRNCETVKSTRRCRLKIIDFHVHTFPEKIAAKAITTLKAKSKTENFTDGTIKMLVDSMESAGINYSVLQPVATKPKQVESINTNAMKINSDYKNIISFGAIHPDFENSDDELKRISEAGIKGIKIHPVYQNTNINDERYIKILRASGEFNLSVLIHAGWDIGFPGDDKALPKKIFDAIKFSPDTKIILAHMGGWRCWNEAEKLFADVENIFIDTAFSFDLSNDDFVRMIKIFGSERVIFGTDSPWASQAETVKNINLLPITEKEKENIFYNNAEKIIF